MWNSSSPCCHAGIVAKTGHALWRVSHVQLGHSLSSNEIVQSPPQTPKFQEAAYLVLLSHNLNLSVSTVTRQKCIEHLSDSSSALRGDLLLYAFISFEWFSTSLPKAWPAYSSTVLFYYSHCILSTISSRTAGITAAFFGLAAWWGKWSGLSLRSYLPRKAHALHATSKSHQKSELSTHNSAWVNTKKKKSDKGKRSRHTWNSFWAEGNYMEKRGKHWTVHQESFTPLGHFHVCHDIVVRSFISFPVVLFNTAVCLCWLPNELSLLLKYCSL